ncbi:DUF3618 domain-containing protein [Micromonospora endolithica]|uniref:DUF3618 domain-containing protein n=1 Tax=Micromonospora endolithica TaxID=230091 RepID=A0A3A9YTV3_9ACTN|nr:DUF3618 domain-containing protein [Micromonospora endolithica]RKN39390.1 DUF3618 domain-containing protein [Micromonospora endolithica]TWJ22678.1 uncharacterized protein DUF3618 [Micromonospora endolithica]
MTGNGRGTGDTEALREEIRRTRVELGETMEALAAKADVKARLRSSADQAKDRMREQAAQTVARVRGQAAQGAQVARAQAQERGEIVRRNPTPFAALAAGAVVAVVVLMIVRGRRR